MDNNTDGTKKDDCGPADDNGTLPYGCSVGTNNFCTCNSTAFPHILAPSPYDASCKCDSTKYYVLNTLNTSCVCDAASYFVYCSGTCVCDSINNLFLHDALPILCDVQNGWIAGSGGWCY